MINLQSKSDIDRTNPIARPVRSLFIDFSVNKKMFECPLCPKTFVKPSSLKAHTFSHTKERPHKCLSQGCDKAFSLPSNLRRHKKMVHMKSSLVQVHPKPLMPPHKLQPIAQCQPTLPEDSKYHPSSMWLPLVPSSTSPCSPPPSTKEKPLSVSGSGTSSPSANAPINTAQAPGIPPLDSYTFPSNLTELYVNPTQLVVPNSPIMQVADDNTTINHSHFNSDNASPADISQPFSSNQHDLTDQDFWWTNMISQLDIFPF